MELVLRAEHLPEEPLGDFSAQVAKAEILESQLCAQLLRSWPASASDFLVMGSERGKERDLQHEPYTTWEQKPFQTRNSAFELAQAKLGAPGLHLQVRRLTFSQAGRRALRAGVVKPALGRCTVPWRPMRWLRAAATEGPRPERCSFTLDGTVAAAKRACGQAYRVSPLAPKPPDVQLPSSLCGPV